MKTVVFAPLVTLNNWKREFLVHSKVSRTSVVVLNKSSTRMKDLKRAIGEDRDRDIIIVVNYEAVISERFYEQLQAWGPEIVVCDELHYIKSYKSQRAKKIVKLADKAKYRFGLTGTPILNNALDLFMQYRFLDKGNTFGKSYFKYRAEYFQDANAAWSHTQQHFPKWEQRPDKVEEISNLIYSKAYRVTKDECLDLPPLIKECVELDMAQDMLKAYNEMKKEFITFVQDQKNKKTVAVVAQLAVTKALRLMQITSGFVKTDDGNIVRFRYNPKLKATEDLLINLTLSNKVILWCAFKEDYAILSELCDKLKIKHVLLTGDQNLEQKQESIDAITNDPDTKVIIANRRAGGIGINLVECKYSIVYSRNFSLNDELQSEARNHRGGSQIHDKIVKIDLVCKESIDQVVLDALQNKQAISDKIIDMVNEI
jgi:SNF2 family DNA or RNA helicase